MDVWMLVVRLILVGVFGLAGVAKLTDRAGSRQGLLDFGTPSAFVPFGTYALPVAELLVALLLLPARTAAWGAAGALVLLVIFIAAIAVNLAHNRRPECHCFGQIASAPIGPGLLLRNSVLALLAGMVLWQSWQRPAISAVQWLMQLSAWQAVTLVGGVIVLGLLAAQTWFLLHLFRQHGRLLLRIDALERMLPSQQHAPVPAPAPAVGLPIGAPAPRFQLPDLANRMQSVDTLLAPRKPVLLLFSDPGCGPCNVLLPDVARWQRDLSDQLTIALVSRGATEVNRLKSTEHGVQQVLLQRNREVAEAFHAPVTPAALVVLPDGTIGSNLAQGADEIHALVAATTQHVQSATPASGGCNCGKSQPLPLMLESQVGQTAPGFLLPDLDGQLVNLASFRGRPTLLLFWNSGCGYCMRMLDALKAWEREAFDMQLLVISRGSIDSNRALGLHAPILLDDGFAVGRAFGASGTPSAVLIDSEGRLASPVVAGADDVLALARSARPALPVAN
jgi:peroxiredoxin